MQQWSALEDIPAGFGPSVVTLGNFDGVHRGHQSVLAQAVRRAHELGVPAVAVTFDPHPSAVLRPDQAPGRLTSSAQRSALLAASGLDALLVMHFTLELAAWTPRRFVEEVFLATLGARCVVVGEDTRFGTKNSGDVRTLAELGAEHGFEVIALTDLGGDERWSSTQARRLLELGDVAAAAQVLGRAHRVAGVVVHGDHRGRALGYPTANLGPASEGLIPADGVYAGWLVRLSLPEDAPDRVLPAAVSVGVNPTFGGAARRVEAYVLDRDDLDLYDQAVAVDFVRFLRPMVTFDGVEPLLLQMRQDVDQCREVLSPLTPGAPG